MTDFKEGDWVRYTDNFCEKTSTTSMGLTDMTSRRGKVILVFGSGKLCNVDWGDFITQFNIDSPSIVASTSPHIGGLDNDEPDLATHPMP